MHRKASPNGFIHRCALLFFPFALTCASSMPLIAQTSVKENPARNGRCVLQVPTIPHQLDKKDVLVRPLPSMSFDNKYSVENAWGLVRGDLLEKMRKLAEKDFNTAQDASKKDKSLGDVLNELAVVRREQLDAKKRANNAGELRNKIRQQVPELSAEDASIVSELLVDEAFEKKGWKAKNGDTWNDGFYVGAELPPPERIAGTFWEGLREKGLLPAARVQQIATLIFLDDPPAGDDAWSKAQNAVDAVKKAERDLAWYPSWEGLDSPYTRARLVNRNNDNFAEPYIWDLQYTAKGRFLIFSGSVTFALRIRERSYRPEENQGNCYVLTEYYFESGEFWKWLWGFDTYIPIFDSHGGFVALLMVTTWTCDKENMVQITMENQGALKYLGEHPQTKRR